MKLMFGFFHRLLFLLKPEYAHHLVVFALRFYQFLSFQLMGKKMFFRGSIVIPSVKSLSFKGRIGLAAGFDKNAEVYAGLSCLGFGFIEVGTVTPRAQAGNPKPRLWRVEQGLINYMGFNNCGVEQFKANLQRYRKSIGIPLLANIGKNKTTPNEEAIEDYKILLRELSEGVDGFVINLSSPNTPGLRELQSLDFLEQIRSLPFTKPTLIKLAPDLDNTELESLSTWVREHSEIAGLVVTNTSRFIAKEVYHRAEGGYSGVALFERALECVSLCRKHLGSNKLLIGVGGIQTKEQALIMRQAGADLLEVYTGFIYRGPELLREINGVLLD